MNESVSVLIHKQIVLNTVSDSTLIQFCVWIVCTYFIYFVKTTMISIIIIDLLFLQLESIPGLLYHLQ